MNRRWRWILASAAILVALAAIGWPVYVSPQRDQLRHADAIFVLGGPSDDRYTLGLEYALEGLAPEVVFSNPNESEAVWLNDLCSHQRYQFKVRCFTPDPATTRGEARALRDLAVSQAWTSVIVVTNTPHLSRARFIVQRCFTGDLIMGESYADQSLPDWAWSYVYQTVGFIRAALQSGC